MSKIRIFHKRKGSKQSVHTNDAAMNTAKDTTSQQQPVVSLWNQEKEEV